MSYTDAQRVSDCYHARPVARGDPQAIQGIVNTLFWLYCGFNISESKNQTVATRWQIFRLKYTKFVVAYSAPPDPLAGFKGSYF